MSPTRAQRPTAYARVAGVASYVPEGRLTNADLEKMVDTSDEWIRARTGISERRVVQEGETTSDLAARAGLLALERAGVAPADVDALVVATASPDMILPSTACLTLPKMGMSCPAYDVNAVCTGFVYALQVATSTIECGRARTVLVVGADALSRHVDFTDRSTCILFGDGAGAVVLRAADEPGVLGIHLGADGSGADLLKIPAGGAAAPATCERLEAHEQFIQMNGNEVFKFAVRRIPQATRQALRESHLGVDDITWLVPHQANQRITDTIAERLRLPHDRVVSTIAQTGNTSAASIPNALDRLYTDRKLKAGDIIALVGFGAGLTWGAAILRWTEED